MTTAFALWGAGSLGAAQVGMLWALTEHGVRADLVMGASVGALNGAYYATRPDADGVEDLARLWLAVSSHDVYPLSAAETWRSLATNLPWHPLRGVLQALGALNYTFPINPVTLASAVRGHSNYLFDNHALAGFLRRMLPIENLADTEIPLSVLATDVGSGRAVTVSETGPARVAGQYRHPGDLPQRHHRRSGADGRQRGRSHHARLRDRGRADEV
jgi:NTE family protein